MEKMTGRKNTFIIQVMNQQNSTWQGTVTWADKRVTEHFRSLLELIQLIDSTIKAEGETDHSEESDEDKTESSKVC